MHRLFLHRAAAAVWLSALLGCGAPRGDVHGVVVCGDKPVVYGTVTLIGSDGVPLHSRIDSEGRYRIVQAPVGTARFGVSSPDPQALYESVVRMQKDPESAARVPRPEVDRTRWFPIDLRHENPDASGINYDVQRGDNPFDIRLK